MFRDMRRAKQQMSTEGAIRVLENNTYGTLALISEDGYPYQVPINYAYIDGRIVMHGAKTGSKVDAINNCDKATFCVVEMSNPLIEEFTTLYRSAIVFGRVSVVDDEELAGKYLKAFGMRFNPSEEETDKYVDGALERTAIMVLEPEHITGKQSLRLFK